MFCHCVNKHEWYVKVQKVARWSNEEINSFFILEPERAWINDVKAFLGSRWCLTKLFGSEFKYVVLSFIIEHFAQRNRLGGVIEIIWFKGSTTYDSHGHVNLDWLAWLTDHIQLRIHKHDLKFVISRLEGGEDCALWFMYTLFKRYFVFYLNSQLLFTFQEDKLKSNLLVL